VPTVPPLLPHAHRTCYHTYFRYLRGYLFPFGFPYICVGLRFLPTRFVRYLFWFVTPPTPCTTTFSHYIFSPLPHWFVGWMIIQKKESSHCHTIPSPSTHTLYGCRPTASPTCSTALRCRLRHAVTLSHPHRRHSPRYLNSAQLVSPRVAFPLPLPAILPRTVCCMLLCRVHSRFAR